MTPIVCTLLLNLGGVPAEARQSDEIVPQKMGSLVRVPCLFQDKVPTITLKSWNGDEEVPYRLLLDSGCGQSLFILPAQKTNPGKELISTVVRRVRLALRVPNHPEDFGEVAFAYADRAYFGADMLAYLQDRKVDGILGSDFFKAHDVFIDYKEQKVFLSPAASAKELEGADGIKLSGIDEKHFCRVPVYQYGAGFKVAARLPDTKSLLFLLVDTGSSVTTLPLSAATHEKPVGAIETALIGAKQNFSGWTEKMRLQLAPVEKPFDVDLWYLGDSPNVLAPCDLGPQVLFSFRRSEMWVLGK